VKKHKVVNSILGPTVSEEKWRLLLEDMYFEGWPSNRKK
jgi:hypothetical protein